ncbi:MULTISPECIES: energy coupling factor transporter S component ThiW [unclassified Exiguobacterium]|uniref:energy coupling factor transporter S component ThiW n=1 Tax=unclassified Exiguobacterium TaxID=2644629 RepID=UPI001EF11389|nr:MULTISPECIES: energy coupling factor transporter S component ThiW [unclassified Exiguobacterium]
MRIQQLTWMAMLIAIAIIGSLFISIPTGVARAYPVQHMVNVIAAVTVGPFGAVLVAFVTGSLLGVVYVFFQEKFRFRLLFAKMKAKE